MARCWILIGMMGSGKSSVGRQLAEISGRPFEDTDMLLERRFGRTVSQIFKVYGEEAFRGHETSVLKSLTPQDCVLATGGGIVMRDANWDEMRRLGTVIYLRADLSRLTNRLEQSKRKRPLLMVEDWEGKLSDLIDQRAHLYEKADIVFDTEDSPVFEVAAKIKLLIEEYEQRLEHA
ncbi:MAG: shikimate kinase [Fimbriimonadaceae bacterium]|nr:shikimate kinase [Fimbriimonadaceae bacterium]